MNGRPQPAARSAQELADRVLPKRTEPEPPTLGAGVCKLVIFCSSMMEWKTKQLRWAINNIETLQAGWSRTRRPKYTSACSMGLFENLSQILAIQSRALNPRCMISQIHGDASAGKFTNVVHERGALTGQEVVSGSG